jgi:hypothetical protein
VEDVDYIRGILNGKVDKLTVRMETNTRRYRHNPNIRAARGRSLLCLARLAI